MPAIRFAQSPQLLRVANHLNTNIECKVWLKGVGNTFIISNFAGFICVPGTAHLSGGRLGRVVIRDITNGDGEAESNWRPVPVNEFVFAMVVRNDPLPDAYVILGDNGWPITTVDTFRHFEKCQPYVT
jgi:hypothetical protein